MEIKLYRKLFFALLCTPSSGSTILINFFNSLNNSYCESEPMFNKINYFRDLNPYLNSLTNKLSNKNIVGFKEVDCYEVGQTRKNRLNTVLEYKNKFNAVIFLVRNPIDNINSIMNNRSSFPWGNFKNCFNTYTEFIKIIENTENKIIIDYDRFCNDPILEINNKMLDYFKITDSIVSLNGIGGIGNVRGKKSTEIKKVKSNNILKDYEINLINQSLTPLYNKTIQI